MNQSETRTSKQGKEISLIDQDTIFYPGGRKSFYDHLMLSYIMAYDEVKTCNHGSHRNVLAGEHCHMRKSLIWLKLYSLNVKSLIQKIP